MADVGWRAIAARYQLTAHTHDDCGVFDWKRRMGVHMAFHRQPINIAIHALWSLVNAWALLLIAYPLQIPALNLDGALLLLGAAFVLYALIDVATAVLTSVVYTLGYLACPFVMSMVGGSALAMVALGALLTAIALAVQVYIGHGVAERGVDDARENFQELFRTGNPVYLMLLPAYTYLDLLFRLGHRKDLARFVADVTDELRPRLVGAQSRPAR
jgi:uncharacterized membrane protein YGL010W